MESILPLLLALHLGASPAGPGVSMSIREASRDAASDLFLSPSALLRTPPVWEMPHAPLYPVGIGGPAVGPYFRSYHPEEWLTHFARNLRIEDTPFTRFVVQVLSFPVRLDVSPSHVHVTLRFATF